MSKNTKKSITIDTDIDDLRTFLRSTDADEIIVRDTRVRGCWYDNEFAAHRAGFDISRFINPVYEARHEHSNCYRLTRRK